MTGRREARAQKASLDSGSRVAGFPSLLLNWGLTPFLGFTTPGIVGDALITSQEAWLCAHMAPSPKGTESQLVCSDFPAWISNLSATRGISAQLWSAEWSRTGLDHSASVLGKNNNQTKLFKMRRGQTSKTHNSLKPHISKNIVKKKLNIEFPYY